MKDLRRRIANIENRLAQQQVTQIDNLQQVNEQSEAIAEMKRLTEELSTTQQVMDTRLHSQVFIGIRSIIDIIIIIIFNIVILLPFHISQ